MNNNIFNSTNPLLPLGFSLKVIGCALVCLFLLPNVTIAQSPGGVSTALQYWVKADAGVTPATDESEVTTWTDQSPNATSNTGTGGTAPTYETTGLNFNHTLNFNGSNEFMTVADVSNLATASGARTAFIVTTPAVITGGYRWAFTHGTGAADQCWQLGQQNAAGRWCKHADGTDGYNSGTLVASSPYMLSWRFAGGTGGVMRGDQDAKQIYSTTKTFVTGSTTGTIGRRINSSANYFSGDIHEIIYFDAEISDLQNIQVQSYLALKYGFTLSVDNDGDGNTADELISGTVYEGDYVASDGTTIIWDHSAYSGYHYDIAGIGRDETSGSGLHQKQAKSHNSDAVVTMSTEAIAVDNTTNSTSLTEDTYLLWGNNDATTTANADLPSGYSGRLKKEWVVEMTGTVSNIHVQFDITGLELAGDAATDFYILQDADGDFTSGATAVVATSFAGNKVTIDDVNFADGQYFTLATKQEGPGGVTSGMLFWLKADAGTNTTVEDASITTWNDQGAKAFNADDQSGVGPTYKESGINYNPALDFITNKDLRIPGGICETESKEGYFFYIVSQRRTNGNMAILRQNLNSTRYLIFRHIGIGSTGADAYYGDGTNNQGRFYGTEANTDAIPHLYSIGSDATSTATPYGTRRYISVDNTNIKNNNATTNVRGTSTNDMYIGSNVGTNNFYDGLISEIIAIDEIPTLQEENRIQSYLAIKYGISLAGMNYVNSTGATVWTNGGGFDNDIAGIGRDNFGSLHQKQSKSQSADAIVTMSTEAIAASNDANGTSLTDGDYLIWGNDNNAVSADADLPGGYTTRLKKEWKVEMTGTVSNVHVEFDLSAVSLPGDVAGDFFILTDADGDFTSGATAVVASSFAANKVTFDDLSLTDGHYFTLTTTKVQPAPGAVTSNLELWLKADAGVTGSAPITAWTDQSGNNVTNAAAGNPALSTSNLNFNDEVTFDGSGDYFTTGLSINEATSPDVSVISVYTPANATSGCVWGCYNSNYDRYLLDGSGHNAAVSYGTQRKLNLNNIFTADKSVVTSVLYDEDASNGSFVFGNGTQEANFTCNFGPQTSNNMQIGALGDNGFPYSGTIAEQIVYSQILSAADRTKVESYLAIKWGITKTGDYTNTAGTVIWNSTTYSAYHYDIAGIGRENVEELHQKQSKSSNSDAIVTMSTQVIAASNDANVTNLTDDAYLLWGNNNAIASADADLPAAYTGRLQKEWVVEMTGTVSNVHVEFNLSSVANLAGDAAGDYFLLLDADGDFTSGATPVGATSYTTDKITFDDVTFTDGQYFTLVTTQVAPGGVASNLHAWWKADAGTSTTTDDAACATWTDQSNHAWSAGQVATGADYWENGINFNPILRFTTANKYGVANGIFENGIKKNMFTYAVTIRDAAGASGMICSQPTVVGGDLYGLGLNANNNAYYYQGDNTQGSGRTDGAWGGTAGQPHLWSAGAAENTSTPLSKNKYITRDNTNVSSHNGTSDVSGGTNTFEIGNYASGWPYDGDMAEIIIFDGIPSDAEEDRIQSYLAIKYGLTLSAMSYLSSAGTVIWDNGTYSAYHNDIAGIGRDDAGSLLQKQAKSVSSDDIVTMSTQAIAASNDANVTTLTDGAYLLWGNNNDDNGTIELSTSEMPTAYTHRLDREWVVEMTGTVSNVHVEFDVTGLSMVGTVATEFFILTDADGDFSTGATATVATSFAADKVTFDDFTFTDGQYFTLVSVGLPTVSATDAVTAITCGAGTSGGTITVENNPITARGVCWSTVTAPTTADSKTTDGTTEGAFVSSITGTAQNTLYYVRAYATNEAGTAYGPEETYTSLQTVLPGSITAAQSICYNATPAGLTELTAATLGTSSYSYQWQSSPDDATWSNVGTDATTYAPGALTASTYYRRQTTSGDCGTANSASILITVHADLTPGTIGTAQALCSGSAPAALTNVASPTGGPGGYAYQWQISTTSAVAGFTNVGVTTIAYAPPSAITVDTWYRREVTSGACGTLNSNAIKMTITAPLTSGDIGW